MNHLSMPSAKQISAWNRLAVDGASLWMEAATVIWLRSLRIAAGGRPAELEAERMVTEKLAANWELGWKLLGAGNSAPETTARRSINHYRGKVRANKRRLGG